MNRAALRPGLQVTSRAALAAGVAVGVAQALELRFPLYAMIAAVIVTDLDPAKTRRLAGPRLVGTVVGTVVGAVIAPFAEGGPLTVMVTVLTAMVICHLFGLTEAAKLAGYVCGIVVLDHGGQPWSYGALRFVETALGVGAAVIVGFIPKLMPSDAARAGT